MSRGFWKVPGEGGPQCLPPPLRVPPLCCRIPAWGLKQSWWNGRNLPGWGGASWVQSQAWDLFTCQRVWGSTQSWLGGGYRF